MRPMTDEHSNSPRVVKDDFLRDCTVQALYDFAAECPVEPADEKVCDACAAYLIAQEKEAAARPEIEILPARPYEVEVRDVIATIISDRLGTIIDREARTDATHALSRVGGDIYEALVAKGLIVQRDVLDEAAELVRRYSDTRDASMTDDSHRCDQWIARYVELKR